jgi:site-specific recombinase XerD
MGDVIHLRSTSPQGDGMDMLDLLASWRLALDQGDKSPHTIRSYTDTVKGAAAWLAAAGLPTDVEQVEPEHLGAFLAARKDATSAGNAAKEYRNLSVFFRWCVTEGERSAPSPMDRVGKIKVSKQAHAIFTDEELVKLLKVCSGSDFESRRDLAIIRVLIDNGVRVSGLAGIRYTPGDEDTHDVFLSRHALRVRLTGGRMFLAPIGKKAAAAVDRYIRMRARHPHHDSPYLWLPVDSRSTRTGDHRLTATGIGQMIERRGEQAGVVAHPHKFRRTMASTWEGDSLQLMRIGGWESPEMVRLYGEARENERAREAHARLSPGDRF